MRATQTSHVASAVLSVAFFVFPNASSWADENALPRLPRVPELGTRCVNLVKQMRDYEAAEVCRSIEPMLRKQYPHIGWWLQKRVTGAPLTRDQMAQVVAYTSGKRLAALSMATICSRHSDAYEYGKPYAAEAIAWALLDARDVEMIVAEARTRPDSPARRRFLAFMQTELDIDKHAPTVMESFFPGAIDDAAVTLNMTRNDLMVRFASL